MGGSLDLASSDSQLVVKGRKFGTYLTSRESWAERETLSTLRDTILVEYRQRYLNIPIIAFITISTWVSLTIEAVQYMFSAVQQVNWTRPRIGQLRPEDIKSRRATILCCVYKSSTCIIPREQQRCQSSKKIHHFSSEVWAVPYIITYFHWISWEERSAHTPKSSIYWQNVANQKGQYTYSRYEYFLVLGSGKNKRFTQVYEAINWPVQRLCQFVLLSTRMEGRLHVANGHLLANWLYGRSAIHLLDNTWHMISLKQAVERLLWMTLHPLYHGFAMASLLTAVLDYWCCLDLYRQGFGKAWWSVASGLDCIFISYTETSILVSINDPAQDEF